MDATLKLWVVIFAVGLLNYLSRLSFIAVFARRSMPPLLARALKYVPAAMLTALVLPMVMGDAACRQRHGLQPEGRRGRACRRRGLLHAQHAVDAGDRNGGALAVADGELTSDSWVAGTNGQPAGDRMRFEGTDSYIATPDLMLAVNAALALERPLLIKGEPGTGKTLLAYEVARALGRPTVPVAHQVHHQGAAGPV